MSAQEKFDINQLEHKNPLPLWYLVFFDFFKTHSVRQTAKESLFVGVYGYLVYYVEKYHLHIDFHPPYTIFYLLGLVLGLLLVFRTNTAYDRWWSGRKLISSLSNNAKFFSSKINAVLPEEDFENRLFFAKMITNHAYSLKETLRYGVKFDELIETTPGELKELKKVYHVPSEISAQLAIKITELYKKGVINPMEYWQMHKFIDIMTNIVGDSERIRTSPVPRAYTSHLDKFKIIFILLMPFALIHYLGAWSAVICSIVYYAEAGLEHIGDEIEDPFGQDENDLPIDSICQGIKKYTCENLKVDLTAFTTKAKLDDE